MVTQSLKAAQYTINELLVARWHMNAIASQLPGGEAYRKSLAQ